MPTFKQEYALNVAEKAKDLRKHPDNMVKGLETWCGVGVDVDMLDNALGDVHRRFSYGGTCSQIRQVYGLLSVNRQNA